MPLSNSQFNSTPAGTMSSNYAPKVTVPSNPGGFGNVPKPNISMPTPRVTSTPTPRVTSTPTSRVTATPTSTPLSTPSISNNPEFRGSYPPATKLNTPSTPVVSKPTPIATSTPISTPTPVATPTANKPSPVKTAATAMFGMGR